MLSNGRCIGSAGRLSGADMENAYSGMQQQWTEKTGILPAAWDLREKLYYWLRKLRSQMAEAAGPQIVQLESSVTSTEILQIQYRGAELKLPVGVDIEAVAALLRSIQSL